MEFNVLQNVDHLDNQYFLLRHGHSMANKAGLIVSSPANGISGYGLSDLGRSQVQKMLNAQTELHNGFRVISSDFLRAKETAEMVCYHVGCEHSLVLEPALRERYFGDYELLSDSNYSLVWNHDGEDANHQQSNVESVNAVMRRATKLICRLETDFDNENFLLVAHGDVLQILQTAFARREGSVHRDMPALQTAELRKLVLA